MDAIRAALVDAWSSGFIGFSLAGPGRVKAQRIWLTMEVDHGAFDRTRDVAQSPDTSWKLNPGTREKLSSTVLFL